MLDSFKARMSRMGETQGSSYLHNTDVAINATFKRDPAYREVIVTHMPSEIEFQKYDAKFIIDTRRAISGDEEVYKLQFRPHVKVPVGSYVDIPNDIGELERWLIILDDHQPQFPMYYILKCNWVLKWVYEGKVYKCECVQRTQSSYNSGLWTDYMFTSPENQTIMWLPTTPYTQTLSYNQRVLICDEGRKIPIAWELSKVLDTIPLGVTRLTFKQVQADMQEDCGKYGIANWCTNKDHTDAKNEICKTCLFKEPEYIDAGFEVPEFELPRGKIVYNGKDTTLRVGGSSKTLTAMFWDSTKEEFVINKPFWNLSYLDNDNLLCSINISFNDTYWDISLADNCPDNITLKQLEFDDDIATPSKVDGCTITCLSDGKEMFKIHVAPAYDNVYALKLRCLQLYNMVGKMITVSAKNAFEENVTELKMEVVS